MIPDNRHLSGQTMVLVALLLVILFGTAAIVIDYGLLVIRANQAQRACDAAALAAAGKYYDDRVVLGVDNATSEATAKAHAVLVASQNNVTITTSQVVFSGVLGTNTPRRVTVTASLTEKALLSRVLGAINAGTVTRKATAELSPVKELKGAAPLGITINDYTNYKGTGNTLTVTMERIQENSFGDGEIIGMDLRPVSGKSPSLWENEVTNGDTLNFSTDNPSNTSINASRGNQSNRLETAINTRISRGETTLMIMVTNPMAQNNGTTNVPLLGIAKIKIVGISVTGKGNNALASFSFTISQGSLVGESDFNSLYNANELTSSPTTIPTYALRLVDDL